MIRWMLAVSVGLVGCTTANPNAVTQTDAGTAGSSGTSGSGSGSTGTTTGAPSVCVPEAPPVWSGPYAVRTLSPGAEPCAGPFPEVVSTGLHGLTVPASTCECSCGPIAIPGCVATVRVREDAACNDTPFHEDTIEVGPDCVTLIDGAQTAECVRVVNATAPGASCEPSTGTQDHPESSWSGEIAVCGAPVEACPDGEVMVPDPGSAFDLGLCLTQVGEHVCPPAYPDPTLIYRGLADTRECGPCTCAPGSGVTCGGQLRLTDGTSCDGPGMPGHITDFDIANLPASAEFPPASVIDVRYIQSPSEVTGGSCAPIVELLGEAAGTEPTTICCRR